MQLSSVVTLLGAGKGVSTFVHDSFLPIFNKLTGAGAGAAALVGCRAVVGKVRFGLEFSFLERIRQRFYSHVCVSLDSELGGKRCDYSAPSKQQCGFWRQAIQVRIPILSFNSFETLRELPALSLSLLIWNMVIMLLSHIQSYLNSVYKELTVFLDI